MLFFYWMHSWIVIIILFESCFIVVCIFLRCKSFKEVFVLWQKESTLYCSLFVVYKLPLSIIIHDISFFLLYSYYNEISSKMVNLLRKTLSDAIHDRVRRLSHIIEKPKSRPSSSDLSDSDEFETENRHILSKLRGKSPSFSKSRPTKKRRRLTVTCCDGNQIVAAEKLWYYNDYTETTVDRYGVKTTSFCASEL